MSATSKASPNFAGIIGETSNNSGEACPACGQVNASATCAVAAEAEQGDGPAASSAASSAVADGIAKTSAVSTTATLDYAAAASDTVAVAVGPYGAAAAGPNGVAVVGPDGASASSNAANSSSTAVNGAGAERRIKPRETRQKAKSLDAKPVE